MKNSPSTANNRGQTTVFHTPHHSENRGLSPVVERLDKIIDRVKMVKIFEMSGDIHLLPIEYENELVELTNRELGNRLGGVWKVFSLRTMEGVVKKDTPLGDCPYCSPATLVVSEKLKKLIEPLARDEVEFLPVEIDGKPGFYYMNVLCVLDALDLEKTELKRFYDGSIKYIVQAQYRDSVVDNHVIFTLPNYRGVYVAEELMQHLEKSHVQGVVFRDTGERVDNPFASLFKK